MKQSKICITRSYSTYYSVKLHKQIQQIDPTIILYAYDNSILSEAITKPTNMPNDISILNFFNNINIEPNGDHSWFQIWLGHDDSELNILANMKYWSS